jgi:F-type H+-transporting ATPase subunit b
LKYPILHSRISSKALGFVFFAVLVSGLAIAPSRLAAQQSAPAATSAAVPATTDTARPDAAKAGQAPKSDDDDINKYRLTPTVQAVAKIIHLPVETTARIFELINFAIIALAIGIPLFRLLPKVIRKRGQTLTHNIASARKVTEDANARLGAVEVQLSKLDEEIAQIRTQVEQESLQDEARIKATIGEESARIVASAEQEISVAAAQARRGLRHFAADLAIEQAAKQLILSPETDRALIADFVGDVVKEGKN